MITADYLQSIIDSKQDLVDNINNKGVYVSATAPLSEVVDKVGDIIGAGTNEWYPHPEWWNIKQMVDTGILEWNNQLVENVRFGYLYTDNANSVSLSTSFTWYTSDGGVYDNGGTHTWDRTKDKICSDGYKVRAVIACRELDTLSLDILGFSGIYIYLGNVNITYIRVGSTSTSTANTVIEAVKCSPLTTATSSAPASTYAVGTCFSLRAFDIPVGVETFGTNAFRDTPIQRLYVPDGMISFGGSSFNGCANLRYLRLPNSMTGSYASTMFSSCYSLSSIELQQNFNASLAFATVVSAVISTSSLEQMIEKYKDRSSETALTLSIGSANIARLSPESIALATAKNITLS